MKKHILFLVLSISFLDVNQEKGLQWAMELTNPIAVLFENLITIVLDIQPQDPNLEISLSHK
ncbi:TPA: hypothetical protein NEG48_001050 [Elizabethkingia anophelis]|nr:hypothetical protein [Elizabethkingia anophelis]